MIMTPFTCHPLEKFVGVLPSSHLILLGPVSDMRPVLLNRATVSLAAVGHGSPIYHHPPGHPHSLASVLCRFKTIQSKGVSRNFKVAKHGFNLTSNNYMQRKVFKKEKDKDHIIYSQAKRKRLGKKKQGSKIEEENATRRSIINPTDFFGKLLNLGGV